MAIADWTLYYIFNHNGLSRRVFVLVTSLIIVPFLGLLFNFALLLLVLRVVYAYLSVIIVHGGLLHGGWTGLTELSEEIKDICDEKLLLISLAYIGINFCCVFDAFTTRFFTIVNEMFRPHPRAQG